MIIADASSPRELFKIEKTTDLVIVGGGLAGVCAALSAARSGLKCVLIQDRPVLGGNASSEVRLWILGATSHGGNNNRFAREGGIINEILLENLYQNQQGNPVLLDGILLDKVKSEKNIDLFLNTVLFEADTKDGVIRSVTAFNPQNSTLYEIKAPHFVDASGDGILLYLSGGAYRMGAEGAQEFEEPLAPSHEYGELLGHSLYFYTRDKGKPVDYVAPEFALKDIPNEIPRYRQLSTQEHGCSLWWVEWGGRLDTIYETEEIKFKLQQVVYGIWDYIKNSGEFPEAENLALDWIGTIAGKRESRRGEGEYMLNQADIVQQIPHYDDVAHGGWSIDLHPADGVFSKNGSCNQFHSKGVYGIPFRCMYSRNIKNLFLGGRLLSASHVAFGSTRVMATCAAIGQAIGKAATICNKYQWMPKDLAKENHIELLKQALSIDSHFIPNYEFLNQNNLATKANITVNETYELIELPFNDKWVNLSHNLAQMLPITRAQDNEIEIFVKAQENTQLNVEIRKSNKIQNHTPDIIIKKINISVNKGISKVTIPLSKEFAGDGYRFLCLMENEAIEVGLSDIRPTGLLTIWQKGDKKVSTQAKQEADPKLGVDSFEFWTPERRPKGKNIAFKARKPLHIYNKDHLIAGIIRPFNQPNAWMMSADEDAKIDLKWQEKQKISELNIYLDCDYDHPLESVQYSHHDRIMPFLPSDIEIYADNKLIKCITNNHAAMVRIKWNDDFLSDNLSIRLTASQGTFYTIQGIFVQ